MADILFDVVGIGNALVDSLVPVTEDVLLELGLVKGAMTLADEETNAGVSRKLETLNAGQAVERSGGSASNTMAGLASFGTRAAFIGKVRNDRLGTVFTDDIRRVGVHFTTPAAEEGPASGHCQALVTPDAQRTMQTFLGASVELGETDLDKGLIKRSGITYLEGYLWDAPHARHAFLAACKIAHAAGRKVAFTTSDSFCVERHRKDFVDFVAKHVDILFANEQEIIALHEAKNLDEALRDVAHHCPVAIVTRAAEGAVVVTGEGSWSCAAEPVVKVVDTTGAGDLFAAGVLAGMVWKKDLSVCLRLGAIAAAEVISHYGARPECNLAELAARVMKEEIA